MEELTENIQDLRLDSSKVPIYLLKTPSSPSDAYAEHLTSQNRHYAPRFLPVLEHIFRTNALRTLRLLVERFALAGGSEADPAAQRLATNNPARKYSGLIFTSQRAVDAFAILLLRLDPDKTGAFFDAELPIYVVGPATARCVRSLNLPCKVLGEESGDGKNLAKFILEHRKGLDTEVTILDGKVLPLLFLVGEQRRDIIPVTLGENNVPVTELVVYETQESEEFSERFEDVLDEANEADVKSQVVVVFSPQGCRAMLRALGWLDGESEKFDQALRERSMAAVKTYIVAIGPSTRDHLKGNFGFTPDACAATPTPEGVGDCIRQLIA
ncbi:tetrapyrrole biosynthesis, uroporphyrinogen III synthase [Piedraia hortae CBS 480.64]|uniref:Tetrapyrrole biosynthesis, uroporphyrinogen III synthase n=1 Tax=Piedraia hortae CBS 480.64 TaxID=1314780 RepID=A0A6A7BTD3_9PEZI|nr:tetrapyrrole biosynthesis, uroporphyrinogen III synthase [Piedraia hortae CBS 480.64]